MFKRTAQLLVTIPLLALASIGASQAHPIGPSSADCTPNSTNVTQSCFVGAYEIAVTRNSRAQLLLYADSRFRWSHSSSAGHTYVNGKWSVANSRIMLAAIDPTIGQQTFEMKSQADWNISAEIGLQEQQAREYRERARTNCPVNLDDKDLSSEAVVVAAPSEAATETAKVALEQYWAAKRALETSVTEAVSALAPRKQKFVTVAEAAARLYFSGRRNVIRSYELSGQPLPTLGPLDLPSVCATFEVDYDKPEKDWLGGIAIRFENIGREYSINGVNALVTYSTGRKVDLIISDQGWAFLPFGRDQQISSIELVVEKPQRATRVFQVPPTASGVFHFAVNGDTIHPIPFQQLSLQANGMDLVSTTFMRGRYHRESNHPDGY